VFTERDRMFQEERYRDLLREAEDRRRHDIPNRSGQRSEGGRPPVLLRLFSLLSGLRQGEKGQPDSQAGATARYGAPATYAGAPKAGSL
jgi:hypothetical protein